MSRLLEVLRTALPSGARAAVGVALALGVAIGAALVVHSWLEARDARIRLQATIAAQQQLIAAAEQREQQRAHELKNTLAQIAELKRSIVTPEQVVRELPQYLPLSQPIQIVPARPETPAAQPGDTQQRSGAPEKSVHGEPVQGEHVAQMPVEDLKVLFDFVQDCRACKVQLAAAQADHADDQTKIAALTKERDAALKAARGGSFWSGLRRGAKWFLIGGVIGAAAVAASR